MSQLRLRLARFFWRIGDWFQPHHDVPGEPVYTSTGTIYNTGKVVDADGPDPQWKPEQHGSVIMQEPDLVRAERERDESL